MISTKTVTAIILVAGSSTRFGKNRNKNLELINNKSILSYSLNAFNTNKHIDEIIVVVRNEDRENIEKIIKEENISKKISIVLGGNSRKESVYNALKNTTNDIAIIHDGARPAIKQEYIDNCLEAMNEYKGVTVGVKSKDTIKIVDDNQIVINSTNRENTYIIQTPQCFDRKLLFELHNKYSALEVTDDCMLLEKDGYKVKIIEGDYTNIKVTTYSDMEVIQEFIKDIT